jgi:hypothetical protein
MQAGEVPFERLHRHLLAAAMLASALRRGELVIDNNAVTVYGIGRRADLLKG